MYHRNRVLLILALAGALLTIGTGYAAATADDRDLAKSGDHPPLHWDMDEAEYNSMVWGSLDDELLTLEEVDKVTQAAERAVPDGQIIDIDRSTDPGEAFEVEMLDLDGVEWDVDIAPDYTVLRAIPD